MATSGDEFAQGLKNQHWNILTLLLKIQFISNALWWPSVSPPHSNTNWKYSQVTPYPRYYIHRKWQINWCWVKGGISPVSMNQWMIPKWICDESAQHMILLKTGKLKTSNTDLFALCDKRAQGKNHTLITMRQYLKSSSWENQLLADTEKSVNQLDFQIYPKKLKSP